MILFNGALPSGKKPDWEILLYDGLNENHIHYCKIPEIECTDFGENLLESYNEMQNLSKINGEFHSVRENVDEISRQLTLKEENKFKDLLGIFILSYNADISENYQENDAIIENENMNFIDLCSKNSKLSDNFKRECIKNILLFLQNNPDKKGSVKFFDDENKIRYAIGFDKQNNRHYLVMSDGSCGDFAYSQIDKIIDVLLKEELNIAGGYLKT